MRLDTSIPGTLAAASLGRFIPEPRTSPAVSFSSALSRAGSLLGAGLGAGLGAATGIDSQFQGLIDQQIALQIQMQLVSLHSNIEKSRHETAMAAIRNVRTA